MTIRDILKERVQFECATERHFELHIHARVRVVAIIMRDPVPHRLKQHIAIRPSELQLIAQASVEVRVVPFSPERDLAHRKNVVNQLRDRTVHSSHHLAQVCSDLQISQLVIVVIHQRSHDWYESVLIRPMIRAIPEDRLRFFRAKCRVLFYAARGEEVNAVVEVPMLASMLTVPEFVLGWVTLLEVARG
jgi:hypothetical protein